MVLRSMTEFLVVHSKMGKRKQCTELFTQPKSFHLKDSSLFLGYVFAALGVSEYSPFYKMTGSVSDRFGGGFFIFYIKSKKVAILFKTLCNLVEPAAWRASDRPPGFVRLCGKGERAVN